MSKSTERDENEWLVFDGKGAKFDTLGIWHKEESFRFLSLSPIVLCAFVVAQLCLPYGNFVPSRWHKIRFTSIESLRSKNRTPKCLLLRIDEGH